MAKQRVLLSWSSGKDSAWSLHVLGHDPEIEVVGLLTTLNVEFDRVAMHSVRRRLLELQAEAAGIDSWIVELPHPCSNEQYDSLMTAALARARGERVDAIAFGDLFLEDIRAYRERQMAGSGFELLFPLWQQDTSALARDMLAGGLEARVTCVDPRVLDASFAGRRWDESFLRDLPEGIDPCGENGEFHTFVYAGPMLRHPVPVSLGDVVTRDGFVFADLLPG